MVLVGYWPLNEDGGDTANDVRNGNNGTINNGGDSTVVGANGILGQNAYSFDGTNDYVRVSDSAELDDQLSGGFTISAWIKISLADGGDTERYEIIGKDTDYSFFIYGDGDLRLDNDNTGGFQRDAGNWEEWTHVVAKVNSDGNGTLIRDNVKLGTGSFPIGEIGSNNDVFIGAREWGGVRYFDGKIQDIRIYNHVLTEQEISYLYSVGKRGLHTSDKRSL